MSCGKYRKIWPKELHLYGGKSPQKSQAHLPDTCWLLCVHGFAQKTSATSFPLDENWPRSFSISGRSQYNDSVVKFLTSDETLSKSGFLFQLPCQDECLQQPVVWKGQRQLGLCGPRTLWCHLPKESVILFFLFLAATYSRSCQKAALLPDSTSQLAHWDALVSAPY